LGYVASSISHKLLASAACYQDSFTSFKGEQGGWIIDLLVKHSKVHLTQQIHKYIRAWELAILRLLLVSLVVENLSDDTLK
jgi:hypothetical protein